ncbi:MAG: hypothetical protein KQH57_04175 [Actinomycetales bacterium]|nr:hypothetical protein [Actinomycetales bacterium]
MRRVAAAVVAVLSALVSVALVVGVVLAPGWEPASLTAVDPLAVAVPPAPTDLVCPGPARLATEQEQGDDVAYDPQFDPAPAASTMRVGAITVDRPTDPAVPAQLFALGDRSAALAELTPAAGAGVARVTAPGGVVTVRADPGDGGPAWIAGTTVVRTDSGDLRGLVAAPCRSAVNEAWLVGGSTTLGSSARLVLQNPGATPAQVSLEVWGPGGPVELAGAAQYIVPAGSERAVLLEGAAAEQPRIVVHVVASGGLVASYLQDSALRGLTPAGVDDVVPGAAPALRQVVPGVSVGASEADGVDVSVLRLLAPEEAGTAQVRVLGPDGEVPLPGGTDVALDAGAVIDLPLGGLPAGSYTVVVDADVPVLAGAMITRGVDAGAATRKPDLALERAWAASVQPGTVGPLALPGLASWHLVVAVPEAAPGTDAPDGPADVDVELVGADGAVTTSTPVAAGTSITVGLDDLGEAPGTLSGLVVRTDDPRVVWAVVLDVSQKTGDLVSVLSPVAPATRHDAVDVRLGAS